MRKRILFTAIVLLALSLQGKAQKFLEIFQDGEVINRIQASFVDSITVEETVPPTINMWQNGNIFLSYYYNDIDSIKVSYEDYPVSYIGVMGFNDDLYRKGVGILAPSTVGSYKSFINGLPQKDGSLLYYAVDNALDMLEEADITTPLKSVHFITFTDGLDLGSIMLQDNYLTTRDYLEAMGNRIRNTQIEDLPLNAYTVGLRGNDVTDVEQFQDNLICLASTDDNAFEVSNIDELRSRFSDIANKIINVSSRQVVSVKIPGTDNGTRMRFVFDGKPADESQLYIEGTFNLSDRSLHEVTYHGMKARSGSTVQGTQMGIFVTYTFTGLQRLDGDGLIPMNDIYHYYQMPTSSNWQINSEFWPDTNTQRSVTYTGTSLFLVLDCSSSLGGDFSRMKSYANEFIDMIAANALPIEIKMPQNVTAALDDNDFVVNVSWDEVQYADSYRVFRSSEESGTYTLVADNMTSFMWTDDNPYIGDNYYRVSAVRGEMESDQSNSAYVNYSLNAPQNVTAAFDDNDFVVNVSWDEVQFADSYKVFRSNKESGTYTLVAEDITSTTWTDMNPNAGDNYYKVSAVHGEMESELSGYAYVKYDLPLCPDENHPHMIDLGLPDGTKWACCNVGATSPEGYGGYYAWGETEEKDYYDWTTYIHCDGSSSSCHDIGSEISGTEYDVAHVKWGGSWKMPTLEQINTLLNNCSSVRTQFHGKDGVMFTGSNGNSVFLPAAGYRMLDNHYNYKENHEDIMYWFGSRIFGIEVACAAILDSWYISKGNVSSGFSLCSGLSVRPVSDDPDLQNAPQNVTATLDDNDFVVNVSWDEVQYADSYKVFRSYSSNGTYTLMAENITSTTWTDTNPLVGINYYKVSAVRAETESGLSVYAYVEYYPPLCPDDNHPHLIDLGLPDGTKWACCNVGATSPEGYGGYYAWGETEEKDFYDWNTYIHCDGSYDTCHDIGSEISGTEYDVAHVKWGGSWKMPTLEQIQSLLDNCTSEWTEVNGIDGRKFTSKINGYSIFLPAASGSYGGYWSGTPKYSSYAYILLCNSSEADWNHFSDRCLGRSVRPVSENPSSQYAPQNVMAALDDNDYVVNLSWDEVQYADSYKVFRSSEESGTYTLVAENITSTTWTDTNPNAGDNYYKVSAVRGEMESDQSSYAYVNYSLNAPQNVTAALDENDFVVNVSWDEVQYADSYKVFRSNNFYGTYTLVAENITSTTWTDTNPLVESNYYKVSAVRGEMESTLSGYAYVNVKYNLPLCPDDKHPHMIDLGLPDGTKWACCNVGATSPEGYGGYYAWGETEEKDYYDWSTYIHCDGTDGTCHDIGSEISGTNYDVAHVKWGGSWKMPTPEQIKSLLDNCTSEWTEINGTNGLKFTSKINGYSIFLPAAGGRWLDGLYYEESCGYYWSGTNDDYSNPWELYFDSSSAGCDCFIPDRGLSVRPVSENPD